MRVHYTQDTWKNENYRFFRFKAWMKALDLSVKPPKEIVENKINALSRICSRNQKLVAEVS